MYPYLKSLFDNLLTLSIKHSYEEQARTYRVSCWIKPHRPTTTEERKVCNMEIVEFVIN